VSRNGECPHGNPVDKVQHENKVDGRVWTLEIRPLTCRACVEAVETENANVLLERYVVGEDSAK
jgi:hypothetical protein